MQTLNVDKWIFVVLRHKNFCFDYAFAFCLLLLLSQLLLLIEEFDCQSWKLAQNAFKCDEAAEVLFTPPFFPSPSFSAPATFWWTSNELNNSKGVANFKFQVLLSLWHESELTLTLPCLPPSPFPPLACTVWGTIHAWLWFACPSLLPYQRCVIRSPTAQR